MLAFDKLSYWEKTTYFEGIDYLIIGSGIVGLSTALSIRERDELAKIVILERGYLPTGASTKNAGFACFGSPSEILDDLERFGVEKVKKTIRLRYNGLQKLLKRIGADEMEYINCGSYELFTKNDASTYEKCVQKLDYLNELIQETTGLKNCFSVHNEMQEHGFSSNLKALYNQYEGELNTGKLMSALIAKCIQNSIYILNAIEVKAVFSGSEPSVETNYGKIQTKKVFLCTNGLTKLLYPNLAINPARAQVLVTSPIPDLKLKSTYHYDRGYYYFRVVDKNRILIGGARNSDVAGETTMEIENTSLILTKITELLHSTIVPNTPFSIDYQWAGIMGVGDDKSPIMEELEENIYCAVRLGGMGIAIGTEIGDLVASKWVK